MNTENKSTIDLLIVGCGLEANPPERQRKRHSGSQQASPGEKPVRGPARLRSVLDKALQDDVVPKYSCQARDVRRQSARLKKDLPSAKPVESSGRTAQPHGVAIADSKRSKDTRAGIRDKCGVEVLQAPAAEDDAQDEQGGR
jgi:hypothetical protein